jgi:hypothetical protein
MAVLGGAAAIFIHPGILVGWSFSVVLADEPTDGLASATAAALPFLVFAVLPILAALLVGRTVKRRASVAITTAAAVWTVAVTSMSGFAAYWAIWSYLA